MKRKSTCFMSLLLSLCISVSALAGVPKDVKTEYNSIGIGKSDYIIKNDNTLWSVEDVPKQILTDVISIDNIDGNFFALKENGDLMAWGENFENVFGLESNPHGGIKEPIKIMDNVKSVNSLRSYTVLFLKNDGSLWMSGLDFNFTVNDGGFTSPKLGTLVKIMDDVIYQSNGYAIKSDHTLWTWQTSLDKKSDSWRTPNITWVSCKEEPAKIMDNVIWTDGKFAIKEDDTLWAWGENEYGQLGTGSNEDMITEPIKIMDNVKSVKSYKRGYNTFILKNDGTLWSCGKNNKSQLGYAGGNAQVKGDPNPITIQTVPKQFMSDVKLMLNNYAIKNDNTSWKWGAEDYNSGEPSFVSENTADCLGLYILKNDSTLWNVDMSGKVLDQAAENVKIIER